MADHIRGHLTAVGLAPSSVQRLWLRQANLAMNQLIVRRLHANTSSAGSLIAFHQHSDDLAPGAVGVIASFGAGYSVGSVILRRLDAATA